MFTIKGSGNIVSQERALSSFIKLHAAFHGTIEITQSNDERVTVECDDNLQEYIQVSNFGRTLFITEGGGIRKAEFTKLVVRVFVRQLDTLVNHMQGDMLTTNTLTCNSPFTIELTCVGNTKVAINAPVVKCTARCEGNIELSGECGEATIKTMMEGNLMARELHAAKISLKNMSQGNLEIYGSEQITIKHMGEGYVHYYGPGMLKDVNMMGSGEVRHKGE